MMARLKDIGRNFLAVTPSDTVDLSKGASDAFYIGGGGDIVLVGEDGDSATFTVLSGSVLACGSKRVMATGTTATGIVALYGSN